jgi:hypothetical protein
MKVESDRKVVEADHIQSRTITDKVLRCRLASASSLLQEYRTYDAAGSNAVKEGDVHRGIS